jgi:transposase
MAEVQTSRLSLVEKGRLIGYFESGLSQRQIARRLNRSFQTVNLWIQRFQNEGVQGLTTRARPGKPRLTTLEEDMDIITASKRS